MNEYVKVVERGKHLPTILSFSAVDTPKGYFKPYKIVDDAETNVIFINDKGNRWYQQGIHGISDDSEIAAIELIQKAREVGNGKVVTFGSSMGAFGAILFAALGGADGCLAFGVEAELKLKASRSERAMDGKINVKYPDLKVVLSGSDIPVYLYSSECDENDLISAYHLRKLPNVTNITIRGMQHPGAQIFHMNNTISNIIREFSEKLCAPTQFDRKGDSLSDPEIIYEMYEAHIIKTADKNNERWLEKLESINKHYASKSLLLTRLGEARLRLKDRDGAEEAWRQAINIDEYQFDAFAKLGNLLKVKGKLDEAKLLMKRAIEINPYHAVAYYDLGIIQRMTNMFQEAEDNLRKAVSLNKNNKVFRKELAELLLAYAENKTNEANELLSTIN